MTESKTDDIVKNSSNKLSGTGEYQLRNLFRNVSRLSISSVESKVGWMSFLR